MKNQSKRSNIYWPRVLEENRESRKEIIKEIIREITEDYFSKWKIDWLCPEIKCLGQLPSQWKKTICT